MAGRGRAGRHDLFRIFVAQFVQRKLAARGDLQRFIEPLGRVQLRQPHARPQILLGVRCQREAAFGHCFAEPDRSGHIEHRLARAQMHMHVTGGDQRHAGDARNALDAFDQRAIGSAQKIFHRDPATLGKPGLQPHRLAEQLFERSVVRWNQQRQTAGQILQMRMPRCLAFEVGCVRAIAAFVGARARQRDEFRQIAVSSAIGRQQHQFCVRLAASSQQIDFGCR